MNRQFLGGAPISAGAVATVLAACLSTSVAAQALVNVPNSPAPAPLFQSGVPLQPGLGQFPGQFNAQTPGPASQVVTPIDVATQQMLQASPNARFPGMQPGARQGQQEMGGAMGAPVGPLQSLAGAAPATTPVAADDGVDSRNAPRLRAPGVSSPELAAAGAEANPRRAPRPAVASSYSPSSFDELMSFTPSDVSKIAPGTTRIKAVREAALRESAIVLGTQWGIRDRSKEILAEVDRSKVELNRRYQFGALMMGTGFLPPVISEAREVRAVEGNVLRTAERAYRIDESPRAVIVVPSWRDWLLVGLDGDLTPMMPDSQNVYPRDEAEIAFWRSLLKQAYDEGRETAFETFKINLARLDRTYDGMRRYYDLFKRGMVTAPVIAAANSVVDTSDPSVMLVGNTLIRIVDPSRFVDEAQKWVPLGN